jgi:hypothetical protein
MCMWCCCCCLFVQHGNDGWFSLCREYVTQTWLQTVNPALPSRALAELEDFFELCSERGRSRVGQPVHELVREWDQLVSSSISGGGSAESPLHSLRPMRTRLGNASGRPVMHWEAKRLGGDWHLGNSFDFSLFVKSPSKRVFALLDRASLSLHAQQLRSSSRISHLMAQCKRLSEGLAVDGITIIGVLPPIAPGDPLR